MCMVVYIASDVPLPLVPFNEAAPGSNVSELDAYSAGVRRQFTKPFVYCVGSHTHCGCGFENSGERFGVRFDADPKEVERERESRRRLAEYLRAALAGQESVELYACWNGEEEREPGNREELAPEDLIDKHTHFLGASWFEPEFLTFRAG